MDRPAKKKVLFSWSGGKDSAMALHNIVQDDEHEVVGLLTTMTQGYDRVTMHGVRSTVLEAQAAALGLSLHKMYIPQNASMAEYEAIFCEALRQHGDADISTVAFGDIFLEDVRRTRESVLTTVLPSLSGVLFGKGGGKGSQEPWKSVIGDGRATAMTQTTMTGLFPLWGNDTKRLILDFLDLGFKAIVTCVDASLLDDCFVGRHIDESFLRRLPANVDPCGENGEFHTFVYDGPIFRSPFAVTTGDVVFRQGFYFCDLVVAGS